MFFYFLLTIFLNIVAITHLKGEEITVTNELKVLVLIIASDNLPVYKELAKIWQSYMHLDSTHFTCYFIRGNPDLETDAEIIEDTIWCKTEENLSPGIMNKTILALEKLILQDACEFDYLLRTNLSSFYVFPKLLEFVKKLPRENCYAGSLGGVRENIPFGSGSGFYLSKDLIKQILLNKDKLYDVASIKDDVLLGNFMYEINIPLQMEPRITILGQRHWNEKQNRLHRYFHFRIKNLNPDRREGADVYMHKKLRELFYPNL